MAEGSSTCRLSIQLPRGWVSQCDACRTQPCLVNVFGIPGMSRCWRDMEEAKEMPEERTVLLGTSPGHQQRSGWRRGSPPAAEQDWEREERWRMHLRFSQRPSNSRNKTGKSEQQGVPRDFLHPKSFRTTDRSLAQPCLLHQSPGRPSPRCSPSPSDK